MADMAADGAVLRESWRRRAESAVKREEGRRRRAHSRPADGIGSRGPRVVDDGRLDRLRESRSLSLHNARTLDRAL